MCLNSLRKNTKLPISWYLKVNGHPAEHVGWLKAIPFLQQKFNKNVLGTVKGFGLQGFKVQQLKAIERRLL